MFSNESEILRKLRLIEWLKAELVSYVGFLYQAVAKNSEQAMREALASVIITCFVLGRRLGIEFSELEAAIHDRLNQNIKHEHEAEKWFGDFSELQRHLRGKREANDAK